MTYDDSVYLLSHPSAPGRGWSKLNYPFREPDDDEVGPAGSSDRSMSWFLKCKRHHIMVT